MEEPFNGAISLALDPDDFVCLILENIIPAAAGCHAERLALHLGLDQGSTLPVWPQPTSPASSLAFPFSFFSSHTRRAYNFANVSIPSQLHAYVFAAPSAKNASLPLAARKPSLRSQD